MTTVKGMGFKDAASATQTIRLASQPGARYKTYWCVRAMAERARHHPAATPGMRAALAVFDDWLKEHSAHTSLLCTPDEAKMERHQRSLLAMTSANAHAFSRCSSAEEFNRLASEDRADALRRLRTAAAGCEFILPATSFVSLFGGPAVHGYGEHACVQARARGLPSFRCLCSMEGEHVVTVRSASDLLGGGGGFRWPCFELSVSLDGPNSRATLTPTPPPGQPTLHSSLARHAATSRLPDASRNAAAAATAAPTAATAAPAAAGESSTPDEG